MKTYDCDAARSLDRHMNHNIYVHNNFFTTYRSHHNIVIFSFDRSKREEKKKRTNVGGYIELHE